MNEIDKLIRNFENTGYFGYLFFVEYDGKKFDSFDENPEGKSVKSEFRKLLEMNNIKIFKGIQQAGRTDKNVSAKENILYINSKKYIEDIHKKVDGLKIRKIVRTIPFFEFPQMISKRFYIYEYPQNLIENDEEKIKSNCEKLSGRTDFKKFTSKKGEKLKNHVREIFVRFEGGKLYFEGDGFLPQQVRIMSNFILNNKMNSLPGEYLTLEKVEMSEELGKLIFKEVDKNILMNSEEFLSEFGNVSEKIENIEKNEYFYLFNVSKKNKSEIIGKNGKNIKKMRKIMGNIIIKEKIQDIM